MPMIFGKKYQSMSAWMYWKLASSVIRQLAAPSRRNKHLKIEAVE
jgi:hypothetical protein